MPLHMAHLPNRHGEPDGSEFDAMTNLAPFLPALMGGALIGLAASLLLLANGKVAGISGILGNLLRAPNGDTSWRAAFMVGLIAGPPSFWVLSGWVLSGWVLSGWVHSGAWPAPHIDAGWPTLLVAGLLVGFGTRLGSGCTSGHGVCGLARLSPRSIAAVCVFMAAAVITVFIARHVA